MDLAMNLVISEKKKNYDGISDGFAMENILAYF